MARNDVLSAPNILHDTQAATKLKPHITILPATHTAIAAIATADLLAFSGMSGEPASKRKTPLRRDLVWCGAHPRHWPDFQFSTDSLWKGMRGGKILVMTIVDDPDAALLADGSTKFCGRGEQSKGLVSVGGGVKEVAAGLLKLRPPAHILQTLVARRTSADRIWGDYVAPVAKRVSSAGTILESISNSSVSSEGKWREPGSP